MKVHSLVLDEIRPLGPEAGARLSVARDRIGGGQVVRKRFVITSKQDISDLRQQVQLTRSLSSSGFLDVEDIHISPSTGVDLTYRFVDTHRIEEVYAVGGWSAVVDTLLGICQSLAYLHSLGHLHGDIKPDNILIERLADSFAPRIVDLELSLRIGVLLDRQIQGTPGFMAPEIHKGDAMTEAVDIFAFGQTLRFYLDALAHRAPDPALMTLAEACTQTEPTRRPSTMWDVYAGLDRVRRNWLGTSPHSLDVPPLRSAGLTYRVDHLRRLLKQDSVRPSSTCIVSGPSGAGVSRLLREYCDELQWSQCATLRVDEIESLDDLHSALASWTHEYRGGHDSAYGTPLHVIADVNTSCECNADALSVLDRAARKHSAAIVLGTHLKSLDGIPPNINVLTARPLTPRECVIATGHLVSNPVIAAANESTLPAATGGNPKLVQLFARRWLKVNHIRSVPEPIDFDGMDTRISDHWQTRFAGLNSDQQHLLRVASVFHREIPLHCLCSVVSDSADTTALVSELRSLGWFLRFNGEGAEDSVEFCCRSARNTVRAYLERDDIRSYARAIASCPAAAKGNVGFDHFGRWANSLLLGESVPQNHLEGLQSPHGSIHDIKLVLRSMLQQFRRIRSIAGTKRARLATDIASGFAVLGSVRRQQRWCNLALQIYGAVPAEEQPSQETLSTISSLYDLTGRVDDKRKWLGGLLDPKRELPGATLGYILSELSAVSLTLLEGVEARQQAHKAHHLLERNALNSDAFVRNLNRLGLSLSHTGHLGRAREYLEQARVIARRQKYEHIEWRCTANLGHVARAMGDPAKAYRCARGIANYYRITNEKAAYVAGLRDQVPALVELGRMQTAARTAQLAVTLASAVEGEFEHAIALNNLGWVLAARGFAADAYRYLQAAVQMLERRNRHEAAVWPKINLAWLLLSAQLTERVERVCAETFDHIGSKGTKVVLVEAHRVLALAAIQRDDFDEAERHLVEACTGTEHPSPKMMAEIDIIQVEIFLWRDQLDTARQLLNALEVNPVINRVQPLRLDVGRLLGHYYMLLGDFDKSQTHLSQTAEACRVSSRYDKQITTMMTYAMHAQSRQNYHMAARFTSIVEDMINRLRRDLK